MRDPLWYADAERSLIGAAFLRDDVMDLIDVDAEELFHKGNRETWAAMRRLHSRGERIDPVTVDAELERVGRRNAVGGLAALSEYMSAVPTADNADQYARLIRHASKDRKARMALALLADSADQGDELIGRAYEALGGLLDAHAADGAIEVAEAVSRAVKQLGDAMQARQDGRGKAWGLPTGFADLDEMLGGLQPGVATILAGRPSMGKSSLARSLADNLNAQGHGVHLFSLEDSHGAYALRVLSDHSRVELHRLRGIEWDARAWSQIVRANDQLGKRRQWLIEDDARLSSRDIAIRVRRRRKQNRTRVVIVDYIQRVREPSAKGDRKGHVDLALDGLLDLARRDDLALVLLSQLNRECESRDNKRPMLSDLRESGELEQAADAVMLLYRDEVYNPESSDKGVAELIVAKNKHGRTGTTRLAWDAATATLRPLVEDRQGPPVVDARDYYRKRGSRDHWSEGGDE